MNRSTPCIHCGTPVRARVLSGLCPACVVRHSLDFVRVVAIADSPVADRLRLPPFRPPSRMIVADYELESEIARGGMGVVYRARQLSLNRPVALKLLLSGQFADVDQVRRFRAEAEAVARLDHPGIVPVYEVGEFEGRHFFSMKLIEGRSLAGAMNDFGLDATRRAAEDAGKPITGPLRQRQRELARFLADIARAVHYAHQRGVLHRDLKPANVLVDADGQPHVTDFGLARFIGDERRMTQPGTVVGTPSYMPPEQTVAPELVTVAADVYSVGAIGYELMTGQPPFEAGNPLETILQLREREPTRPRELAPEIEKDLETILLKCLSKDPAHRYVSALALAEDLDRFIAGEPIQARPARFPERAWRWSCRHPAIAILTASLSLLVLAVAIVAPVVAVRLEGERARAETASETARNELREATLARARAQRLTQEMGQRSGGLRSTVEAARIRPDEDVQTEAIAQLARFDSSHVEKFRPRLAPDSPVAMSPDFKISYQVDASGVIRAVDEAKQTVRWEWPKPSRGRIYELIPSPDEQHLVILRRGKMDLLDTRAPELVTEISLVEFLRFSPDGRWFLILDRERKVQRHETATGRHLGTVSLPGVSPGDVAICPDPRYPWLAVLSGRRLEIYDWKQQVVVASLDQPGSFGDIVWSGEWLAAGSDSGELGVWHLPSGRHHSLTAHKAPIRSVQFIPRTAFLLATTVDGQMSCWDVASGDRLLISGEFLPLQVSKDGRKLLHGTTEAWGWTEFFPSRSRLPISFRDEGHDRIRSVCFSANGRWLLVGKQVGVHLYDRVNARKAAFQPLMGTVLATFVPGMDQIAVQTRDSLNWFSFDPANGSISNKPLRRYQPLTNAWMERGAWCDQASTMSLILPGGILEEVDLVEGRILLHQKFAELSSATQFDQWSTNLVFWPGRERQVVGLNLNTTVSRPLSNVASTPTFAPDGHSLLLSGLMKHELLNWPDGALQFSDTVRGRLAGSLPPAAWTPDSKHVALVTDRDQIVLRRRDDWKVIGRLTTPQPSSFTALRFSPGARWLAVGNAQGSVEIWDLARLRFDLGDLNLDFEWPTSSEDDLPSLVETGLPEHASVLPLQLPRPHRPIQARLSGATPQQVDLGPFYNTTLGDLLIDPPRIGPNLVELPVGLLRSAGVDFEIRGFIQLTGNRHMLERPDLPVAVRNIPVNAIVHHLHLLGAAIHAPNSVIRPLEIATLHIRYQDGGSVDFPIRLGEEIEDQWSGPRTPNVARNARVAWRGFNSSSENASSWIQLHHSTFTNPHPERAVESVDLISAQQLPAPFFVALSVD
ncbi:MAG: protein kinase [Verrucomicrobia bacterium]|nr:protein kinase [Verrucomicrobiota bacterium]